MLSETFARDAAEETSEIIEASRKMYSYVKDELKLSPQEASRALVFAAAMVIALHIENKGDYDIEMKVMAKLLIDSGGKLNLFKEELLNVH